MKTNTTFAKILFLLSLTAAITSCGSSDNKKGNTGDTVATTAATTTDQPIVSTETFKETGTRFRNRPRKSVFSPTSLLQMASTYRKKTVIPNLKPVIRILKISIS